MNNFVSRNTAAPARRAGSLILLSAILAILSFSVSAQTQQLPISEYLNALPNTRISAWVEPATGETLVIDAYGKLNARANLNAGTTIKGKVSIQNLADNTKKVTIHIHAKNAVCWGFNRNTSPGDMLFGYSSLEPGGIDKLRTTPAIGDAMLLFESTPISAADPINWATLQFDSVNATIMCNGVLRAASGHAEGTEGFAQTTQVGRFNLGTETGCAGNDDEKCYPAEKVQFKPIGN